MNESTKKFYEGLSGRQTEIALMDYCLYKVEKKGEFEVFYITQWTNDFGIDGFILQGNKVLIIQISKVEKTKKKLEKFLDENNIKFYRDITGENELIKRKVCTLKKSKEIEGIEIISWEDLYIGLAEMWDELNIEKNKDKYRANIESREEAWEDIYANLKNGEKQAVEDKLKLQKMNFFLIKFGEYELVDILHREEKRAMYKAFKSYKNYSKEELEKKYIMVKIKERCNYKFTKELEVEVEKLIDYIEELFGGRISAENIRIRQKYISIINKMGRTVIYMPYKYVNNRAKSSHGFGIYTTRDLDNMEINLQKVNKDRITLKNGEQKKHGCSFKTEYYLVEPNLDCRESKKFLKELVRECL